MNAKRKQSNTQFQHAIRHGRCTIAGTNRPGALALALLAAIVAVPAQADELYVTNTNDSGAGSLRAAMQSANLQVGVDHIAFAASGTIVLASPLPAVADDLEIAGPGVGSLTISGNDNVSVFTVNTGTSLHLSSLNVVHGSQASGDGGCFYNAGNLILESVQVMYCVADGNGGGIFNAATGTVTLLGGYVYRSDAYRGGGIHNLGDLFVEADTTIAENDATFGAGIYSEEGASVAITDSIVWGNAASLQGGGIMNSGGALTVTDSLVGGNMAEWDAGGISSNGEPLTVSGTRFYQNSAGAEGGAIKLLSATSITKSSFYQNTAGSGGAIYVNSSDVHIRNSTFSGNSAGTGGALDTGNGDPTLSHVTLAGNSANDPGGIATINGDFTAKNIIIVGTGTNCDGSITTWGRNLVKAGSDFSCNGFEQVFSSEPLLGSFDYHGGSTRSYALAEGSVAIDRAFDCTDVQNNPVNVDQRGLPRPADGDGDGTQLCDVGAFEALADVIFANGFD